MSLKPGIGSAEYLMRRIPKNAKYQDIKTRLDTGASLSKYMERVEDIKRNYKFQNGEIFKRLKVTTFAKLILQVASISELESSSPEDAQSMISEAELECLTVQSNGSSSPLSTERGHTRVGEGEAINTDRSTLLSVISGVGELTVDHSPEPNINPESHRPYLDCPYLLLDVRDREQYESCHIISAHSHPVTFLSRTMNPFTKEVLEYKNAPGKIIIVYDEDERTASQAATVMCQRGFENLFMLSGGLKVVNQKFPGSLVTGTLPPQCTSASVSDRRRRTAPPKVQAQVEQRWRFTAEELDRIQEQLDETALSTSSSRMSTRVSPVRAHSKASRSRQSSSLSSRGTSIRPWK